LFVHYDSGEAESVPTFVGCKFLTKPDLVQESRYFVLTDKNDLGPSLQIICSISTIFLVGYVTYLAVWIWAMWKALTIGDDVIAQIGRRILRIKWRQFISGYSCMGLRWFRIFGFGVSWKDTRIHPLAFSERYGYQKGLRLGHWQIHLLMPM
jgi:hypothetical protein